MKFRHGAFLILAAIVPAHAQVDVLAQKQWIETSTAHFNIYSSGRPQDIYKLAAQLEQFCEAYSLLAGTQAVVSVPTVVMAFPDHEAMEPFLPLYQGKPANLSGFFTRSGDENLIVLSLADASGMEIIFHEYAHLLFRHNDLIWPLWLKEGMAEVYSTFQISGRDAQIARPIGRHLELLAREPLMPLHELFSVSHDSPQYNESTRQGIFYAESWLLTHYLVAGDNPALKARFGQFTQLLKEGQLPGQAFTNALGISLPAMQILLHRYLLRGQFAPIHLALGSDISAPIYVTTSFVTPVNTYFRLGDELLRIGRDDAAENYFIAAQKLAPASPLPYEGLGLLAAQRDRHQQAVGQLQKALQLGSTDFLTPYIYAKETFEMTGDAQGRHTRIADQTLAAQIQTQLARSLAIMPDFAAARELLGFVELVQGDNLPDAEQQLRKAINLEPENPSYLFSLAQAQMEEGNIAAARSTLQPLLLPNVDEKLRAPAQELIQRLNKSG